MKRINLNFGGNTTYKFKFVVNEGKTQSAPRRKVPACSTIKTEFNN